MDKPLIRMLANLAEVQTFANGLDTALSGCISRYITNAAETLVQAYGFHQERLSAKLTPSHSEGVHNECVQA